MDLRYLRDKEELVSKPAVDEERRNFLTAGLIGGALATTALASSGAQAQPAAAPFWPHPKWGKDDQAGASNWMTPAKVLDAAKLIRDGKVYRVGRIYESGMPLFGKRAFQIRITPASASVGTNRLLGHDELVFAEIGQTGTQFDGLGHIGLQMGKEGDQNEMRFYNGITEFDMVDTYGLKKLGIENCKPIVTRGHLFDIEA